MKILAINGSPRKKMSNTLKLVEAVLEGAKAEGAETELIDICAQDINFCTGCSTCYATGECVHDDDAAEIYAKILEADGIVLGSPVYLDTVTAQLKRWMDRLADTIHCQTFSGKYGCSVATAGGAMHQETVAYMNHIQNAFGIVTVGGVGVAFAEGPEAFPNALKKSRDLGSELVNAIKTERKYPDQEAYIAQRREYFCRLVAMNRDTWPHEYESWVKKGALKP
ncbi:MAG: flavodoxin family protein [Methanoregulaceae archaeon]